MDVQALTWHELSDPVPGLFLHISRFTFLMAYDLLGPAPEESLLLALGIHPWSSQLYWCGSSQVQI